MQTPQYLSYFKKRERFFFLYFINLFFIKISFYNLISFQQYSLIFIYNHHSPPALVFLSLACQNGDSHMCDIKYSIYNICIYEKKRAGY